MIKEFRDFIARGNVIDLAVAVIIGAAFGKIVNTLVEGVLMPPLGMLLGSVDFSSLFVVLDHSKGAPASLAAAKAAGIPVIAYGLFLNDVVNFLILAFAVFMGRRLRDGRRRDERRTQQRRGKTSEPRGREACFLHDLSLDKQMTGNP